MIEKEPSDVKGKVAGRNEKNELGKISIILEDFISFTKRNYKIVILSFIIMLITTIVTVHVIYTNQGMVNDYLNDFAIYYTVSKNLFTNPGLVYDPDSLMALGIYPYRYLIFELVLLYPFTLMPVTISYVIFNIISFWLNVCVIFILIQSHPRRERYMVFTLLMLYHLTSFITGQICSFIGFFIALSYHYYKKRKDFFGGIFLGISIMLKPVTIFIIPLVLLNANTKSLKIIVKKAIPILIPLLPDIVIFLASPSLLQGFIDLNFRYYNSSSELTYSVSFSNGLVGLIQASPKIIIAIILITSVLVVLITGWRKNLEFQFALGLFLYFIIQPDIWSSQYVFLIVFLVAFTSNDKTIKKIFIYAFFAEFVLIVYELVQYIALISAFLTLIMFVIYLRDFILPDHLQVPGGDESPPIPAP